MATMFTSDTHFHHKHVIGYCSRPFLSLEDMNAALIKNWNEKVKSDDDEVFFLGDFAFCGVQKAREIFDQLRGRKHLVAGNHDRIARKLPWETIADYRVIRPQIEYEDDEGEIQKVAHPIVLFHFPIISWDGMGHGSWHIHGHCHGNLKDTGALRWDVGVDANHMAPISLEQLQAKMALRTVVPVDHHKPDA